MFGCKFWCKYKWNAVCNLFVSVFMWNRSLTQILRIQFTYWKLTWNKSLLTPQLHNLDLFAWSLQRLMMRIRRNMAWLSSSHSIFMQKYHFPIKTNISRFSIYHFFTLSRDSFVRIPKSPPQHNLLLSSGNFRMFPAKLENYKTIQREWKVSTNGQRRKQKLFAWLISIWKFLDCHLTSKMGI